MHRIVSSLFVWFDHPGESSLEKDSMVLSNVVFVVTIISSCSVFSQGCVQVSARLANVSCGAVAALYLLYRSLSVFGSILSLMLVSSCHKVVISL